MKNNFNRLPKAISLFIFSWSIALIAANLNVVASPENLPQPRQEQLLNNLKVLVWSEPASESVTLKLRIHGGAAFDIKGKEGAVQLLADVLFPDVQTKQFFEQELGGSLAVECNYDFIEITVRGRAAEFNRILETVRDAVVNLQIEPETFEKMRAARLKLVQSENAKPVRVADNAVRKQLFGEFPYGRSIGGTPETLAKIERADLLLARDRLLTADNATLAVAGNVKEAVALGAVKQLFGAWQKADKSLVTTFRQPDAVDGKLAVVKMPDIDQGQIRFALRGAARNAVDFDVFQLATQILQERWQAALPPEINQAVFVRHEPHVLPGIVVFGISVDGGYVASYLTAAPIAFSKILTAPVTADEFNRAKTNLIAKINDAAKENDAAMRFWLDADTYKINTKLKPEESIAAVSQTQTQDLIASWRKQTPVFVAVALGKF